MRPMTFLETSCTLAEAKATAVSAIISIIGEPRPGIKLRLGQITQCRFEDLDRNI